MRTLVILSEIYPYHDRESFLGNELEYIDGFDTVILIPCFATDMSNNRLPEHLRSKIDLREIKAPSRLVTFLYAIRALFEPLFWKEIMSIKKRMQVNLNVFISALKNTAIANSRYSEVRKVLKSKSLYNDILFYSYWLSTEAYIAVKLKKRYNGSTAISRAHRIDLYETENKLKYLPYREWIISNLDKIYAIADDGRKALLKYPFANNYRISVSRLGTLQHESKITYQRDSVLRIVSCSALTKVKRVDKIIEALKLIYGIDVAWTHYGDGLELNNLIREAQALPPNIKVDFAGNIQNDKLMDIYSKNNYDIFISTSSSEGIPVSIMEAMSFGIPIIATDVGGTSECVVNKLNGYLMPVDFRATDLASYILGFSTMSQELYMKFRENAYNTWNTNYRADVNYPKLYLELSSNGK